jgi:hypothetical protein
MLLLAEGVAAMPSFKGGNPFPSFPKKSPLEDQ